ncbi:unnamed protein product, partial [Didymodactylos carnosus]
AAMFIVTLSRQKFTLAFTTERFVVVAYPLKRNCYRSNARAHIVILCITVVASVLYSSTFFTTGIELTRSTSTVMPIVSVNRCATFHRWITFTRRMNIFDVVVTFIIPFIGIVVFNSIIIYKSQEYNGLLDRNDVDSTSGLNHMIEQRAKRSTYHKRMTRVALIISFTFLLLNTPLHVLKAYYFQFSPPDVDDKSLTESIIEQFTFYLYYTNFSINFFLYSLCGENFRTSLVQLFQRKRSTTTIMVKNRTCQKNQVRNTFAGHALGRRDTGDIQRLENLLHGINASNITVRCEQILTKVAEIDRDVSSANRRNLSTIVKYYHRRSKTHKTNIVKVKFQSQSHLC